VNKRYCVLPLMLLILLTSCTNASENVHLAPTGKPLNLPTHIPIDANSLRAKASERGLLIGAAIDANALEKDKEYSELVGKEFSILTPENVMKFDTLEPAPNVYDFKQADELVAYAQAHQMQIHGHNFVWYRALPDWIKHGTFTRAQLIPILHDFITTVMTRYKGKVAMWDIANEAVDGNGAFRPSIWYNTIGPDFLDMAYQWAHEADPQVELYYNDYGIEVPGVKADAVYTLLKNMRAKNIPINGIGFQMHLSLGNPLSREAVISNMQRFAALGLKIQITEMDVQIQGDSRPLQERLEAQANIYQDMLSACLAVSACEAFIMWGFTDRYTWIPAATGHPDQPLIFDSNYQEKPAYKALFQTLQQK
jgi:endo-1,4-beta-xylanase